MTTNITKCLLVLLALALSGCATVKPYDYTALKKNAPRSILVIPPQNNSVDVTASYSYLSTVSQPLAEKGYYVFPVSVIDAFLKENGLPTPMEMNSIPLDKIKEHIGADAVLYVTIDDWGQKFVVLSSKTIVKGSVKLVSVESGELLWDAPIFAEIASDSGGHGLVGALVNAVVTQIAGSVNDRTPDAARMANNIAFYSAKRGLLPGPYAPAEPKKK
ncbi:DUF799 domain-containing protein [Catenovulum sediminis]|uniref:GNA1162 family protein n=1 Tax=Catenovulum sediminis TaxID=1740262 RepID=A0ABV1RK71_9ALTE|nr:GNA1162 family protein [Catenovulum sediminis]